MGNRRKVCVGRPPRRWEAPMIAALEPHCFGLPREPLCGWRRRIPDGSHAIRHVSAVPAGRLHAGPGRGTDFECCQRLSFCSQPPSATSHGERSYRVSPCIACEVPVRDSAVKSLSLEASMFRKVRTCCVCVCVSLCVMLTSSALSCDVLCCSVLRLHAFVYRL